MGRNIPRDDKPVLFSIKSGSKMVLLKYLCLEFLKCSQKCYGPIEGSFAEEEGPPVFGTPNYACVIIHLIKFLNHID